MEQDARYLGFSWVLFSYGRLQGWHIYRNWITCYDLKQPRSHYQVLSLSAWMIVVEVNAGY